MNVKQKRYMLVGGGSGGHLTPLTAVAIALKANDPESLVEIVGQKNEDLSDVIRHSSIDNVFSISAGKFRRYNGESMVSHLFDVKTVALNIRDFFRFVYGTFEAWRLLGKQRPDSIFLKGGFVSVPVGYAARLRKIPYITHDSDAIPGLANRMTAKHAVYNTTAMPANIYPYNQAKTRMVGIPLRAEFEHVSYEQKVAFKKALGINSDQPVLFCIGGGLGAQKLNQAVATVAPELFIAFPKLRIIHISGKKLFEETQQLYKVLLTDDQYEQVRIIDFNTDIYSLSGSADVIVTRGGATNIAEFAVQAKPCIVVPNPVLTGGQQLHNAKVLVDQGAALVVDEGDTAALLETIIKLLSSKEERQQLSQAIVKLSIKDAGSKIAEILVTLANTDSQET